MLTSACGEKLPVDEGTAKALATNEFRQADDNYFQDMDGSIESAKDEINGRNTWMIWTSGNQAFRDHLANNGFGAFDLLKTISSYPGSKYSRNNRFSYQGLINGPGFVKATAPDEYGLWLDQRVIPPEFFKEEVYGKASGLAGLRLYPNPEFDEKAQRHWDPQRYYNDPSYYLDSELSRPYRVGTSCAFCHAGLNLVNPPEDPDNPPWSNLSTNVGLKSAG